MATKKITFFAAFHSKKEIQTNLGNFLLLSKSVFDYCKTKKNL